MTELSREEITRLLNKKSRPRVRKKKFDFGERTYDGWFKIPTIWGNCVVPKHDRNNDKPHPINPDKISDGRMVAEIGNHWVCRYCYLARLDEEAWGAGYWL